MEEETKEAVREVILSTFEVSLESQLRAVRKLRSEGLHPVKRAERGRSQPSMAYDILIESGIPLHVNEIIGRIAHRFGVKIDCESLYRINRYMKRESYVVGNVPCFETG